MDTDHVSDTFYESASMGSDVEQPLPTSPQSTGEELVAQERGRSRVRESQHRRRERGSVQRRGRGRGSVGGRRRRQGSAEVQGRRGSVGIRRGGRERRVRRRGCGGHQRSSSVHSPISSTGKGKIINVSI